MKMGAEAAITELRDAYLANAKNKKILRLEITEKYKTIAEQEFAEKTLEGDVAFARRLAALKESYDLRVGDIQDHVLKTKTWRVWEKWRDLANIEPEQERLIRKAKLVGRFWRWDEDFETLWLVKSVDGKTELPMPIPVHSWKVDKQGDFEATFAREEMSDNDKLAMAKVVGKHFGPTMGQFFKIVEPIIRAAEQEGNTTVPDLRTE